MKTAKEWALWLWDHHDEDNAASNMVEAVRQELRNELISEILKHSMRTGRDQYRDCADIVRNFGKEYCCDRLNGHTECEKVKL